MSKLIHDRSKSSRNWIKRVKFQYFLLKMAIKNDLKLKIYIYLQSKCKLLKNIINKCDIWCWHYKKVVNCLGKWIRFECL